MLSGDWPYTRRFFDAILTGCIPVVVAYPSYVRGKVSWYAYSGPPWYQTVPFPYSIDYSKFVVEVPVKIFEEGGTLQFLDEISAERVTAMQQVLFEVAPKFGYDYEGSSPDAFSMIMEHVLQFVYAVKQKQVKTECEPFLDCENSGNVTCPRGEYNPFGDIQCCTAS